jgi:S-DNA-T family DNA segregation ATPase FtsK/SpoIIIE
VHELFVTVAGTAGAKDVVLAVDDDMASSSLLDALAPHVGAADGRTLQVEVARLSQAIDPTLPLGRYELRSGDQLRVSGGGAVPSVGGSAGWTLRAVSGPRSGATIGVVGPTPVLLGRGQAVGAGDLDDPQASRRHCEIFDQGGLRIRDLGSSNGTAVNGQRIGSGLVPLVPGDRVQVGQTQLVVEAPRIVVGSTEPAATPGPVGRLVVDDVPDTTNVGPRPDGRLVVDAASLTTRAHLTYASGTLRFNRPPRVVTPEPVQRFTIDPAPDTPPKRKLPIGAFLIPIVLGGVIYAVTGSAIFLLFMAAGPAMAIFTFVDDRRSGRRDFKEKAEAYRRHLGAIDDDAGRAQAHGVSWRHAHHPAVDLVVSEAVQQGAGLWHRRPQQPDFLDLRVGLADQSSFVSVQAPERGDEDLLEDARAVAGGIGLDPAVPAVVPLGRLHVAGVVGEDRDAAGLATWLTAQIAAQHSPRDVALAVLAPDHVGEWQWLKWLPHVHRFGDEIRTIAADDGEASSLFAALRDLAERRADDDQQGIGGGARRWSPHVVVVIQPPLRLSPREMAAFLELAPTVGFSIIWIDADRMSLPGECRAIVELGRGGRSARVTFTDGGMRLDPVQADSLTTGQAEVLARALAPLRDVSGDGGAAELPGRVDLLELYEPKPTDAEAMIARWRLDDGSSLGATIGVGEEGPLRIDLRKDGPHGLVAGTTGAGKSELLQALVAALAVEHPPSRLTFVLIDYKGGAAFKDVAPLPHTVGFVTDLDAHLTHRALVSLNAELRRREHVLKEHGAKDLEELVARRPDVAPPSLLIVIDEFAALKTEVPEFVDGVVDVAQRGRSLGVHLLLATQKPGGVITGAIQANTNLRIALRVADPTESTDVIGKTDAAQIPRSAKGRAYVRTGPTEIRPFQAAYVGGAWSSGPVDVDAEARTFHFSQAQRAQLAAAVSSGGPEGPTDVQGITAAARAAAERLGLDAPRRPWLDPLPDVLPWAHLGIERSEPTTALRAVVGWADQPKQQHQGPYVLDLDEVGHLIVYGTAGKGKTTLLRSLAASLAASRAPEDLHLYGLDFAGRGLGPITALPHCGDVVVGDDVDRVRRLISLLVAWSTERKARLGEVGAAGLPELRRLTGERMPHVVVLLDGFGQFWQVMEPLDRSQHVESFTRIISEGRSVGIHIVLTADRRAAVPPMITSTISSRAVLRLANADEYLSLGLTDLAKSPPEAPGRTFFDTVEVQVAALGAGEEQGGAAQAEGLLALGERLRERWGAGDAPAVRLLPEVVPRDELPAASFGSAIVPLGLDETNLDPALVDLTENPALLVTGPDRSGRTTALDVLTAGLQAAMPGLESHLLLHRQNALADRAGWREVSVGVADATAHVGRLATLFEERASAGGGPPMLIVLDDADELTDGVAAASLDTIVKRSRDAGALLLVGLSHFKAQRSFTTWVQVLRNGRQGLLLQPEDDESGDVLHVRLPRRAGLALPPGRGYLIRRGRLDLVQVAS